MKSCFARWRSARDDSDDSSFFEGANDGADALRKAAVKSSKEQEQGPVQETQADDQQARPPDSGTNFENGNPQTISQPGPPVNGKNAPSLDVNSTKDERGDHEAENHTTNITRHTEHKEGDREQFAIFKIENKGRNSEGPGRVFRLKQQAKDGRASSPAYVAGDMSFHDFAHWRTDSQSLLKKLRLDEEEDEEDEEEDGHDKEGSFDEDAVNEMLMNDMKEFEYLRHGNESPCPSSLSLQQTARTSAPPIAAASDNLHLHRHRNRPEQFTRPFQPGASLIDSYNDPYLDLGVHPSQSPKPRTLQSAIIKPDYSVPSIDVDSDSIGIPRPVQNERLEQRLEELSHQRHTIRIANYNNGSNINAAPVQENRAESSSDEENENMSREDVSFDLPEARDQDNMKRTDHSSPKPGEAPVLDEQEMQRRLMDVDTNFFPSEPIEHDVAAVSPMNGSNPSSVNHQHDETQNVEHERLQQQESKQEHGHQGTHHEEEEEPQEDKNQMQDHNKPDASRSMMSSPAPPETPPAEDTAGKTGSSNSSPASNHKPRKWNNHNGTEESRRPSLPHRNSRTRLNRVPSLTVEDTSNFDDPYSHSISSAISRRRPHQPHVTSRLSRRPSLTSEANTEATNSAENTGAIDYAMQFNGVASTDSSTTKSNRPVRPRGELTRVVSLSSIASGASNLSDDNLYGTRRDFSTLPDMSFNLSTLDEEKDKETPDASAIMQEQHIENDGGNGRAANEQTTPLNARSVSDKTSGLLPHAGGRRLGTDLKTQSQAATPPSGLSPKLRDNLTLSGSLSEKRNVSGPHTPSFARNGKSLTLKEQSSTIDRLSKENFDLKMRIHFLNEALDKRSEEGIKEMISENVELKSDKLKLQKDNQALRRKVKELEESATEKKDIQTENRDSEDEYDDHRDGDDDGDGESGGSDDEELMYLRERIESYEYDVERLQNECIQRESEKRRLADIAKSLGDGRSVMGSDVLTREERVSRYVTSSFGLT